MIFSAAALWLFPIALAALLWIRFFRTRKQELLAGSLLVWKRLAAQQPLKAPRRFEFDRSLLLQGLALAALVAAIANPRLQELSSSGRTFVIVVDNGPLSRFRAADGQPIWATVKGDAVVALKSMRATDSVVLLRAAPAMKILSSNSLSPTEAIKLLEQLQPALSGPDSATLLEFARNAARTYKQDNASIFSSSPAPTSAGESWFCCDTKPKDNIGFVSFGSVPIVKDGKSGAQVLVRIHNAGSQPWKGAVMASQPAPIFRRDIEIAAGQDREVLLDWVRSDQNLSLQINADDGLNEDNQIIATFRQTAPLSVRFHSTIPALERLFSTAIQAKRIPADSQESADLEIYHGAPPLRLPSNAKALLMVEPSSGYRFFFEVGDATLDKPRVVRDEIHPLTDKFESGGDTGLFHISRAVELLRTGAFTSLLKDAKSQRTLAARFVDEQDRPGYVLAFTPGNGAPPDSVLAPELATLLIRIAREVAGGGDIFSVSTAANSEALTGEPLALDDKSHSVLDERVTSLQNGKKSNARFDAAALAHSPNTSALELRPWLIVLSMVLMGLDFLQARRAAYIPARV